MAASYGVFSKANYAGTDQGVDFSGQGLIPALGPGVVTNVSNVSIIEGGSYPQLTYRLTGGPYKGRYVYVMENFTPMVSKGQTVKQGQAVGWAKGAYPYIEVGFASNPQGTPVAALYPDPHSPKPAGLQMQSFIFSQVGSGKAVGLPPAQTSGIGTSIIENLPGIGPVVSATQTPAAQKATGSVTSLIPGVSLFDKLTQPGFWIRALEVIGGGIIMLLGLYLLARQVGLGVDVPLPAPAKEAANTIQPSSRPRVVNQYYLEEPQSSRIHRMSERAQQSDEIPY